MKKTLVSAGGRIPTKFPDEVAPLMQAIWSIPLDTCRPHIELTPRTLSLTMPANAADRFLGMVSTMGLKREIQGKRATWKFSVEIDTTGWVVAEDIFIIRITFPKRHLQAVLEAVLTAD